MKFPLFLLMLMTSSAVEAEHRYQIIQEKVVVEYVNNNSLELKANVFKFNSSVNAVNMTITPKIDFHPNGKVSVRGFKSLNDKYQLPLFRYDMNTKQALQMESFGVQSLRMDYSRPPLVWPLQKGVTYRIVGWNPDGTKFLPNIPAGKWMFRVIGMHPDNTKAAEVNWFISIE